MSAQALAQGPVAALNVSTEFLQIGGARSTHLGASFFKRR
jgi:hypothetical protein